MNDDATRRFREAMINAGLNPPKMITPGLMHRFPTSDRAGDDAGWCKLFQDGRGGVYGDHRGGLSEHWQAAADHELTATERASLREQGQQAAREADAERERCQRAAQMKALTIWRESQPATEAHGYVAAKGTATHGARVARWSQRGVPGCLIVPLCDTAGIIWNLQAIAPQPSPKFPHGGNKDFLRDGRKRGCFCLFGALAGAQELAICEGWATAATIHELSGWPVAAAMDAGNLLPVAEALRVVLPKARIVIAADDDRHTSGNPGLTQARAAAECVGGSVAAPSFETGEAGSDWNDYAVAHGRDAAREALVRALRERGGDADADALPAHAEIALARRFLFKHGDGLRYCATWGQWLIWDRNVWRPDQTLRVKSRARRFVQEGACDEKIVAGRERVAARIASEQCVSAVERLARTYGSVATAPADWDADLWRLNTPRGLVDLHTGTVAPSNPAVLCKKLAGAAPGGDCPTWLRFLGEATSGDGELIDYLQRLAGYMLTGDTSEHLLLFVHGPGGNGKGVFVDTLTEVLGDYATRVPMETFVATQGERHSADIASMDGARLVVSVETEDGRRWAEAKIKQLTGSDPITARFMRQDFFTYRPQFKLLIVGNHKPRISNCDEAMRRRLRLIPFTHKPDTPDRRLREKLRAEYGGILQWMIDGCLGWRRAGLAPPAVVNQATADYFADEDAFGRWIDERVIRDANVETAIAVLFQDWRHYAESAEEFVGTTRRFVDQMLTRGAERGRSADARRLRGFRLRDVTELTGQ